MFELATYISGIAAGNSAVKDGDILVASNNLCGTPIHHFGKYFKKQFVLNNRMNTEAWTNAEQDMLIAVQPKADLCGAVSALFKGQVGIFELIPFYNDSTIVRANPKSCVAIACLANQSVLTAI